MHVQLMPTLFPVPLFQSLVSYLMNCTRVVIGPQVPMISQRTEVYDVFFGYLFVVERKAIEFHVLVRSQVDHKRNKIRTAEKSVTHLLIAIVPRFSSKLIQ